jgi:T-complex protein 1 subunit zeta
VSTQPLGCLTFCVSLTIFCCFQGLHPCIITEGFDKARVKTLKVLKKQKIKIEPTRESLLDMARTSLRTKIHQQLADVLTDVSDTILMFIVA